MVHTHWIIRLIWAAVLIDGKNGQWKGKPMKIGKTSNDITGSTSIWKEMSRLATEQALASNREELQSLMIKQLKQMTQSAAVVFSLYDHQREVMVIQRIEAASNFIQAAVDILGKKALHMETPVSREEVASKRNQTVIAFSSLTEVTQGEITPAVSKAFHLMTGIDRFLLIQHFLNDRLYGTTILVLKPDHQVPIQEMLEFYASVSAASLRRIEAEETLMAGQERLKMVIEGTQAGIWEWNVETGENLVDQRWADIIGRQVNEVAPRIDEWKNLIHPDDYPAVDDALDKLFNNRKEYYGVDFRMKHKQGYYVWVHSKGKVNAWSPHGKPLRISGTHMDITERKEAEKAAEAANEAKSRFLANVSHEIRTPLNGIMGFAQLLRETSPGVEERQYAEFILQSSETLLAIVGDVLDLAKIESGKVILRESTISLKEAVEAGVAPVKVQADESGIEMSVVMDPHLPSKVMGDSVRLRQILMNLTANAVKFTQEGRVQLKVEAVNGVSGAEEASCRIRFTVEDTGIGMTPETLEQIFKPFYQADDSYTRQQGGTGLGLPITRELVELMGGFIEASSQVGVGTTIIVEIPFERAGEETESSSTGQEKEPIIKRRESVSEPRQPDILVVEDQEINRKMLEMMLKKQGYFFDVANDGAEAVKMVENIDYGLILMDVQMPRMDGLEATRWIRALPDKKQPKIVALTAYTMEEDQRRCVEAGMDGFVGKPVDIHQLQAVIEKHLRM